MLKLKLQHFGHLMRKADSLEKTLMLEKIESRKRRGQQNMKWLDGITDPMDMSLSKLWEMVKDSEAWCAEVHGVTKNRNTDSENKYLDIKRERGSGKDWEIGMGTYTLLILCMKETTNEKLSYSTGNSPQCTVVT